MISLSKRLYTVARAVTPGSRAADVGTDHGHVPVYLVEEGISPGVIASDVNIGPLLRAAAFIDRHRLADRIDIRQGSGLWPFEPDETDTVIMAGMGGDLISRLLAERPQFFAGGREFVLQPQSEWFKVRKALHEHGYRISYEWMVFEDGIYYVIIKGVPGDEMYESESDYQYGRCLIENKDPLLMDYLDYKKEHYKKILSRLKEGSKREKDGAKKDALSGRIKELNDEIFRISEILDKMKLRAGR